MRLYHFIELAPASARQQPECDRSANIAKAAAAGPSGATAASVGGNDILTYKEAKGLFAGVSLGGASLEPDNDANQRLYGRSITPQEIVQANAVPTPTAAQGMVTLLDSKYAKN